MAKAYWVVTYRSINNTDAWAAYAKMAAPAIEGAGGRFIARGMPDKVYEAGMQQRVVLIEFDNIAKATAAHDTAEYQAALKSARQRRGARNTDRGRRRVGHRCDPLESGNRACIVPAAHESVSWHSFPGAGPAGSGVQLPLGAGAPRADPEALAQRVLSPCGAKRRFRHGSWIARSPAEAPAIRPNTAPFMSPVPPG